MATWPRRPMARLVTAAGKWRTGPCSLSPLGRFMPHKVEAPPPLAAGLLGRGPSQARCPAVPRESGVPALPPGPGNQGRTSLGSLLPQTPLRPRGSTPSTSSVVEPVGR